MNFAYKLQKLKKKWIKSINDIIGYEGKNFIKGYLIHLIPKLLLLGIVAIVVVAILICVIPVAIIFSILFKIFKVPDIDTEKIIFNYLMDEESKYGSLAFDGNPVGYEVLKDTTLNVSKYLELLFWKNMKHNTMNEKKTYLCSNNRRRSLGDIYLLTRHYRPDISISTLIKELIKMCENKRLGGCYCTTIHKYVFTRDSLTFLTDSKTEYHPNIQFKDVIKAFK